jgi:serine/threonine protein phosphatase PrpC/CRP-like cAMP-binding protein
VNVRAKRSILCLGTKAGHCKAPALAPAKANMEIRYWAGTDVGRKRAANEDNFLIDKQLKLFVVADGMGGHASGEIASAMAVHGIRDVIAAERDILDAYDDDDPKSHVEVCTLLEYAVHETCERIFLKARQEPEKRGMGTTLVALLIIGARGFIAYVGDSRIYLLRGGVVYQLTEDHSLRNELIRMGKITAEEFEDSPYANLKNAMTRAVGVYEHVEVDTLDFDVIPGDSFLLCSDGLYEYLDDSDIANTIGLPELRDVPGKLIDHANTRGGKDNITAVVVQVGGEDLHDRAAELNLTLDTLGQVPIFGDLSYQQLVRILNLARQMPMQAGQTVFAEGDEGNELFVVLRGKIELSRGGVVVAVLGEGAHLGEMALIDASPRSTTGRALEDGKLLAIARDDFYQILRREPPLAVKLLLSFLQILAKRLRQTTADLADARTTAHQVPDLTDALSEAVSEEPARRRSSTERALPAMPASLSEAAENGDPVEVIVELEDVAEPPAPPRVDVTQIAPAPTPPAAAALAPPPPPVGPATKTGPVAPVIAPSPPTVTAPVKPAAISADPGEPGGDIFDA